MDKLDAIIAIPDGENTHRLVCLTDGEIIRHGVRLCADLIKAIAETCKCLFIENAYHVLAANGLLDRDAENGIDFSTGQDGLPVVVCLDPPTIVFFRAGQHKLIVLDPANYGLRIDDERPFQQMAAIRSVFCLGFWPTCAVSVAENWKSRFLSSDRSPQMWESLPADLMSAALPMGGNCGASRIGQCPGNAFHLYDLSSAYLGAATQYLPMTLLDCGTGDIAAERAYEYCAEVSVHTADAMFPYRPSLEDWRGRKLTYFPTGSFRTVLCGQELQSAVDMGCVLKIHRWEHWLCEPFLAPYASAMYSKISGADTSIRSAVKTIALAGLGNYARKVRQWKLSPMRPPEIDYRGDFFRLEEDGVQRYRCVSGTVMKETVANYHPLSSPQVWAWIAAAVRIRLASVLRHLGKHVFYWDTDSVIVDGRGAKIMESRHDYDKPFGWRKKDTAKSLTIHGYRRYSFGDRISIGIPDSAREVPGGRYVWESPETFDEAMGNRHYPDGTCVKRSARLRGTYQHGRICEDGAIVPWHIENGKIANELF